MIELSKKAPLLIQYNQVEFRRGNVIQKTKKQFPEFRPDSKTKIMQLTCSKLRFAFWKTIKKVAIKGVEHKRAIETMTGIAE